MSNFACFKKSSSSLCRMERVLFISWLMCGGQPCIFYSSNSPWTPHQLWCIDSGIFYEDLVTLKSDPCSVMITKAFRYNNNNNNSSNNNNSNNKVASKRSTTRTTPTTITTTAKTAKTGIKVTNNNNNNINRKRLS